MPARTQLRDRGSVRTGLEETRKAKKTIVAFLQNPWFRPGTSQRYIDMYGGATTMDQKFHRKVLEMSATGRALRKAFGPLYDEIIWDNANPRHGTTRDAMLPPDSTHMAHRIALYDAKIILLFGRQAAAGWERILSFKDLVDLRIGRVVLNSKHPMARGSSTDHLKKIGDDVRRLIAREDARTRSRP